MIEPLPVLVEGIVDQAVILRLLDLTGLPRDPITIAGGKVKFDKHLIAWNRATRHGYPRLAVRDLDQDAACPAGLISQLLPDRCERFCVRVAVSETESWLLADAEGLAQFFGLDPAVVTREPEGLAKPKTAVVDLARRCTKTRLRDGMVPDPRSGRLEGPAYASFMVEFAKTNWSPERAIASNRAPSLNRAVACLRRLKGTGTW